MTITHATRSRSAAARTSASSASVPVAAPSMTRMARAGTPREVRRRAFDVVPASASVPPPLRGSLVSQICCGTPCASKLEPLGPKHP